MIHGSLDFFFGAACGGNGVEGACWTTGPVVPVGGATGCAAATGPVGTFGNGSLTGGGGAGAATVGAGGGGGGDTGGGGGGAAGLLKSAVSAELTVVGCPVGPVLRGKATVAG